MKSTIQELIEEIRDWEMEAGESYCDYFFDRYSYDGRWMAFLESKEFHAVVDEIKEDVYICTDGTVLGCTDQQLKFEPYSTWHEEKGGKWDEDVYRKDVALWAEFLLLHDDIYQDHKGFLVEYFE
jgi:hypothetical protein